MVRFGEVARRWEAARALWLALLLAAGAGHACTTNHDALARQPKAGTAGGGSGGGSGFGMGGFGNTGNQTSQGGRRNPDEEPPGPNVLTVVNGVIDAPSVRLCFARVDENGEAAELVGTPLPTLGYAASTVLTEIDGLSLVDDVIQPWVIAGDLARIEELDCEAAVALALAEEAAVTPVIEANATGGASAGGAAGDGAAGENAAAGAASMPPLDIPALRARSLAALPAGTVNIDRSILMVLTGCMGGAAYRDRIHASACGAGYSPDSPTLQPIIVKLSRDVRFDKVGLQAVHASLPSGSLDIRASGSRGAVSLVFASSVSYGSIEPRPADTRFTPVELGVAQSSYGLQAVDQNGQVAYQEAWSDVLAVAGIDAIVSARTYTAIFLGPDPLLIKKGWWNSSAFALVDNDPTRL